MAELVKDLPVYFKFKYVLDGISLFKYLDDEPLNWDKVNIIVKRDLKWFGVNYQFTDGDVLLEFDHVSGIDIVKSVYEKHGSDGEIILEYGYTKADNSEIIEYEGKLNLNTYKLTQYTIACSVEMAGLHEKIKTRLNTKISVDDTKSIGGVTIPATDKPVDGIVITGQVVPKKAKTNVTRMPASKGEGGEMQHSFYWTWPTNSRSPDQIEGFTNQDNSAGNSSAYTDKTPAIVFSEDGNLDLSFDLYAAIYITIWNSYNPYDPYIVKWWPRLVLTLTNSLDVKLSEKVLIANEVNNDGYIWVGNHSGGKWDCTWKGSWTVQVKSGYKLYIYGWGEIDGLNSWDGIGYSFAHYKSIFNFYHSTTAVPTQHRAFKVKDLLEHNLKSITDISNRVIVKSSLLNNLFDRLFITNGICLRVQNYFHYYSLKDYKQPQISTSDLIDSLRSILALGLGYEFDENNLPSVVIEPLSYFFNEVEILRIEDCADYSEETAREFIYNEIEVGYAKFPEGKNDESQYDNMYLDDVNTKLEFVTPVATNSQKLSLISNLISSSFAIELTRRLALKNEDDNTSSDYDDDNFIICTDGNLNTEAGVNVFTTSNIETGTTQTNLRITPRRNLNRWAKFVNSGLKYKKGTDTIKNTSYKNNGNASHILNASKIVNPELEWTTPVTENESKSINTSDPNSTDPRFTLFVPVWITFKARLSIDQVRKIKDAYSGRDSEKRNGFISAVDLDGNTQEGWLFEMTWSPVKEEVTFKLLKKQLSLLQSQGNCSDYANWTFEDFESNGALPSWIEACSFENFN